jgi:hypothetical protein
MRGQLFSAIIAGENVEEVNRRLTDSGFAFTITECLFSVILVGNNVEEVNRRLTDSGFAFTITGGTEETNLEESADEFSVDDETEKLEVLSDALFSVDDETAGIEVDVEDLSDELFWVDDETADRSAAGRIILGRRRDRQGRH